jgi:hypothetical protein
LLRIRNLFGGFEKSAMFAMLIIHLEVGAQKGLVWFPLKFCMCGIFRLSDVMNGLDCQNWGPAIFLKCCGS